MARQRRRNELLKSACDVFAERGYYGASVADIIERAGIARGTFYLYFESKRQVFEELLDGLLAQLRDAIRRVDVTATPDTIQAELRGNALRVFDVLTREPGLTRLLLHEAVGRDPGFDRRLGEFYSLVQELLAESIQLGQELGLVRPLDVHVCARFVLGAIKEALYDGKLGAQPDRLPVLADELIRYVFEGIGHTAPRVGPSAADAQPPAHLSEAEAGADRHTAER